MVRTGSNDPDGFDVVVNATPVGMKEDDPLPFDVARIAPSCFVGEVVMKSEYTPLLRAALDKGCDVQVGTDMLFEIDVAGAASILALDPDALLVFIDTPDREEQRRRLVGRGDDPDRVEARIRKGDEEREAARRLPMHHIVNDELHDAVAELEALIDAHREARRVL